MDLSMLRQVAKGRYGLDRSTGEDSLFTNPVLKDLINEKHRWFASVALCYYRPDFYQPLVVGQSAYSGEATVIEIDPKTVVLQYGVSAFTPLPLRLYPSLVSERGALQTLASGTPTAFWMRAGGSGDGADQSRVIELCPAPAASTPATTTISDSDGIEASDVTFGVTSVASLGRGCLIEVESEQMLVTAVNAATSPPTVSVVRGYAGTTAVDHDNGSAVTWNLHNLIYGAWHYPVDLEADDDRPALDASEHDRLIPAICWGMAELEQSRGRADAPVAYWQAQAQDKALELFEIIRRGTREAPRTAQVGASPLDDARERRQAKLGGLARRMD